MILDLISILSLKDSLENYGSFTASHFTALK